MTNERKQTNYHLVYYIIMCLLVIGCIEVLSQLTFYIIFNNRYTTERLRKFVVQRYDETDQRANFLKEEIIHPYVGYVWDYGDEKKNYSTQGFLTDYPPTPKKEEGKLNVVLLGGSVAGLSAPYIRESLEKTFKLSPRLVNLAVPGYKQPQQLMALTYMLSLGAEYDLVINLDGFNDIVLPYVENYSANISLFFPRSWKLRITDNPSHEELVLIGKVKYLQDLKQRRLKELSSSIFNSSATYGLLKMVQFIVNNKEIYDSSTAFFKLEKKSPKRFVESGPLEKYENISTLHEAVAEVWANSSLLINSLAKGRGFEYYHILQPDQYVEGSKRLTKEEKRIAYNDKHIYRKSVVIGYPMLIQKGRMLIKNNVNFIDATMLFANVDETLYCDDCCHLNKQGMRILADYIIQEISRHSKLEQLKPAGPLSH